jgi:hypothetical protein
MLAVDGDCNADEFEVGDYYVVVQCGLHDGVLSEIRLLPIGVPGARAYRIA